MRMKKANNKREQLRLIRKYLHGLMSDVEERSFFDKIKTDESLRRLAAAEVVLCKNYEFEQRRNELFVEELQKIATGSLSFDSNRDIATETDIKIVFIKKVQEDERLRELRRRLRLLRGRENV